MKKVNMTYLGLVVTGIIILIVFMGLSFMEPWASLYREEIDGKEYRGAYGEPYWVALMFFLGGPIFMPLVNYITHNVITVKYNSKSITTSLSVSGFFWRYLFVILGVLMFAIVIEDLASLFFAELLFPRFSPDEVGTFLNEGGVMWSAAGDIGWWLPEPYITILGIQFPTMYLVFAACAVVFILLAGIVPRFWYRPVTKRVITSLELKEPIRIEDAERFQFKWIGSECKQMIGSECKTIDDVIKSLKSFTAYFEGLKKKGYEIEYFAEDDYMELIPKK